MDQDIIHKTVLQKLSKRAKLLKRAVRPDKMKIYTLEKSSGKNRRRSNLRSDRRRPVDQHPVYRECVNCDPITGIEAIKPFYKSAYLDDFYYQLEAVYYANRSNNLIVTDYGSYAVFFQNFNLYQTVDYCYMINPALGVYVFRYLVDMAYILKVPRDRIDDFYLKSKLIIVRYTDKAIVKNQFDSLIKITNGPAVIMPIGVDANVYDLIPIQAGGSPIPQTYTQPVRVFSKNGSILFVSDDAKDTWQFNLPRDSIASGSVKYELILYPNW